MEYRYRYVDFGITFRTGIGDRAIDRVPVKPDDKRALYENEIALDVGGVCWGYQGEDLAVIDHHFARVDQFPSATAAALHYAFALQEKFRKRSPDSCIWLVTHRQPDFDALCSMYMVRSVLEDGDDPAALASAGVDQVGLGEAQIPRINWFDPNMALVPDHQRWRILLGAYASRVDNCRRISCPPDRALHSVLYTALKRGRNYGDELSGAVEFFEAAKEAMQNRGLNPLFDSVLEKNASFEPELSMLNRETEAYHRDIRRARKAIVFVPKADRAFREWFTEGVSATPLLDANKSIIEQHLKEPGQERIQMDGVYLRDPECLLFKEWARLDMENSALGAGFTFTAVAYSAGRQGAKVNESDYYFALNPEMARGCNLYSLWARLQAAEVRAIRGRQNADARLAMEAAERQAESTNTRTRCRGGFLERAGTEKAFFSDPWFDGSNYACTIVPTPNRGTYIGQPGARSDLMDDPVVAIVREELERSLYSTQVTVEDLPACAGAAEKRPFLTGIQDHSVPKSSSGYFRLATVQIDKSVSLTEGRLAEQIAAALWRMLSPDVDGTPTDFLTRHLLINPEWVGVWSRRGVAIACREESGVKGITAQFRNLVGLARDAEAILNRTDNRLRDLIAHAELLLLRDAKLQHMLALPESRVLSRFFEAIQMGNVLGTLRDVSQAAADRQRNEELAANTRTIAKVQTKLEWLEVFFAGVYFTELARTITELESAPHDTAVEIIVGSFILTMVVALCLLRPWQHGTPTTRRESS